MIRAGLRIAPNIQANTMKIGGFLLLLSGWGIVMAALALLHGHMVPPFIYAGFAVEILGLVLVFRGHLPENEDRA